MQPRSLVLLCMLFFGFLACQPANQQDGGTTNIPDTNIQGVTADITGVTTSGQAGAYTFSVTLKSPDTGCQQYADWWEVVSLEGKLLYRRILLHSHVNEQPFTRSGGPVGLQANEEVWIRGHMNTGGYGGVAWKGSVDTGFRQAALPDGFGADLASAAPLPENCAY